MKYNTLDSNDLTGMGGTKFNEEIEIKIRQIENLKMYELNLNLKMVGGFRVI